MGPGFSAFSDPAAAGCRLFCRNNDSEVPLYQLITDVRRKLWVSVEARFSG